MRISTYAASPDPEPAMISGWRLRETARCLDGGGIVAYPTEAVYGLGCDPRDGAAVLRLLRLKQRPLEKGLILIGARFEHLDPFLGKVSPAMLARVRKSWPGPHTWLLPAAEGIPAWLRGSHDAIAVRITAHPIAAALCDAFGSALVSTSANRHGHPPAHTSLQVRLRFGDEIDRIVCGRTGTARRPTVICDAATGQLIRPG